MIEHRPFASLGGGDHGWLNTRHHFSFADYHDPRRMGWGALRVWNDDEIAANSGFPPHPHRDMEIITFVRQGAISHEDNQGNAGRTEAGDVQVMAAGSGIFHAEYNREPERTDIFQIWIQTAKPGAKPSWGTRHFPRGQGMSILASGFDGDDALHINANARVMAATLKAGETLTQPVDPARHQYLVADKGAVRVNGVRLSPRDGAAITGETALTITADADAEIVLVDTD